MRVVLTFYKNFLWFTVGISLIGCYLIWLYGGWQFSVAVFWLKVVTNTLLGLYVNIFDPEQFFFYNNLGFSRLKLFVLTSVLDMMLWLCLSVVTIKFLL
jgi:hypothetical protein